MRFCKVTTDKVHSLWHASQVEQNIFSQAAVKHVEHPTLHRDTVAKLLLCLKKKKRRNTVCDAAKVEAFLEWWEVIQIKLALNVENKLLCLMTAAWGSQMMKDTGCPVLSVSHITCFPVHCATGEDYLRFEQCVRQRIGKAFLCPWIPRQSTHQLFKPHAERNHRMLSIGASSQDS